MPVLLDPLPLGERRLLRAAVLELATTDHRRRIPPVLHVGEPGGPTSTVVDDPTWDHGLRTEIVGAALRARSDPSWVWVTRSGPLSVQDVDASWLAPTLAAAAERGVDPAYVVVTRHGWFDPRSELRQEWTADPRATAPLVPGVDRLVAVHALAVLQECRPQRVVPVVTLPASHPVDEPAGAVHAE